MGQVSLKLSNSRLVALYESYAYALSFTSGEECLLILLFEAGEAMSLAQSLESDLCDLTSAGCIHILSKLFRSKMFAIARH